MRVETKTVLELEDGATLVSSEGGDLYWLVEPDGTSTPCSLQQACRLWMLHEESPPMGDDLPLPGKGADGQADHESRDRVKRTVEDYLGEEDTSPWQRELLERLGLTVDDVDPGGSLRKKRRRTKKGD